MRYFSSIYALALLERRVKRPSKLRLSYDAKAFKIQKSDACRSNDHYKKLCAYQLQWSLFSLHQTSGEAISQSSGELQQRIY